MNGRGTSSNEAYPNVKGTPAAQDTLTRAQKGPPALLPLGHGPEIAESVGVRVPRKAAMNSIERLKVFAETEESDSDSLPGHTDFQSKIISDTDSKSVTVFKTKDPNFDVCRGCKKVFGEIALQVSPVY